MKKGCSCLRVTILLFVLNSFTANAQKDKTDTIVSSFAGETKVEIPPSFPGGAEGWRRYLEKNLQYPKKAYKKNIQGLVRVQMVVDKQGNVSEVKALNDPGGGLAAEAERVIKDGPKWVSAEQNGRKVSYRFIQSITFQLE